MTTDAFEVDDAGADEKRLDVRKCPSGCGREQVKTCRPCASGRFSPARNLGGIFFCGRTVGDDSGGVGETMEPLGLVNAIRATVTHRTRRGGGVNNPDAVLA